MSQNSKTIFIANALMVLQPIAVRVTPSGEIVESGHTHTKRVWARVKNNREIPPENALDPDTRPPYLYPYSFK